jgi:hypothetical protein
MTCLIGYLKIQEERQGVHTSQMDLGRNEIIREIPGQATLMTMATKKDGYINIVYGFS